MNLKSIHAYEFLEEASFHAEIETSYFAYDLLYPVGLYLIHPYNGQPSFTQKNLMLPSLGRGSIYLLFFAKLSKQKHEVSRMQQKY